MKFPVVSSFFRTLHLWTCLQITYRVYGMRFHLSFTQATHKSLAFLPFHFEQTSIAEGSVVVSGCLGVKGQQYAN